MSCAGSDSTLRADIGLHSTHRSHRRHRAIKRFLVLLAFIFLNAGVAVTVSTIVIFLQYLLLRRYTARR